MPDVLTLKVLVIVEDDPDMRMMVRSILSVEHRLELVGEAASAAEAIEVAKTADPGLIILDHSIEGDIMGLQAAPLLKQVAPLAKILLFTAFDMRVEAMAEPAVDGFLSKSQVRELLPTVRRMMGL